MILHGGTMPDQLSNVAASGCSVDPLNALAPTRSTAPYFDHVLNAWVLSRHADVLAAFRTPSLIPGRSGSQSNANQASETARLKMRTETMDALSSGQTGQWREFLAREADSLLPSLLPDEPIDLIESYATPLCLLLAASVTNISLETGKCLGGIARAVSAAAADPENLPLKSKAERANAELIAHFSSGPSALRDSTFVALSQTVPCILGNAWLALIDHPKEWRRLHLHPALLDQAIEELLRYAGLVRTLFRTATEDLNLNGAPIRKGDVLILRIIEANRDPERFACAHQLNITREDGGHFALGAGLHACVGASLIRMAVQTITRPLLRRFASAILAGAVEWRGGSTFQSPQSLWVRLSEDLA